MKMIQIKQLHFTEISKKPFDIFIASSGFERRASHQASRYFGACPQKIALGFSKENTDPIRIQNDTIFNNSNFVIMIVDGEDTRCSILNEITNQIVEIAKSKGYANIYIDYSCMTKNWYAYLLYNINQLNNTELIKLTFGYTHSIFVPFNGTQTLNRVVMPLFGYCSLSVPSKPTALIIGMGNEPARISGLKEYFDAIPFLFYTDATYNPCFSKEIEKNSNEILAETRKENIFQYPIHDLIYTFNLLDNLCNVLLDDYRVILAPCGPKPFSLLSMIVSLKSDNLIEVWRISPGHKLPKVNREPSDLISVLEVTFSK
jgi:hypothetical protein